MKQEFDTIMMEMAKLLANHSYCTRRQVGCIIAELGQDGKHRIVSNGYNGTPSGEANVCEDDDGKTKSSVIHAEMNAINKLRTLNIDMTGLRLYVTTAPCPDCAAEIINEGFSTVFYSSLYHTDEGIKEMQAHDITVYQID